MALKLSTDTNGVAPSIASPIHSAEIFYRTVDYVFSDLIGLKPQNAMRNSHVTVADRLKGLFGTPRAFYGVIEAQDRGSLHIHFLLWTSVPADILSDAIYDEQLTIKCTKIVDSIVSASVPDEDLQRYYNRKQADEKVDISSAPVMDKVTNFQTHRHRATCKKGKNGLKNCRMGFPRPLAQTTGPVEIFKDADGICRARPVSKGPNYLDDDVFPRQDTNITTWTLNRPSNDLALELENYPISNGYLTEFNPTLTDLLNCNTCVSFLGDNTSAKCALYYLSKYVTKSDTTLSTSKVLIADAIRKNNLYGSVASDFGTDSRLAKSTIQRILMNSAKAEELSHEMIAAVLLGYKSILKSHSNTYCFVSTASSFLDCSDYIENRLKSNKPLPNDENGSPNIDIILDIDNSSEKEHSENISLKDIKSKKAFQHVNYALRGKLLMSLNLYEYVSLIDIVELKDDKKKTGPGRIKNTTIRFDANHPQYESHCQRLVTKLRIPLLTGLTIPTYKPSSTEWEKYYFSAFVPWGPHNMKYAYTDFKKLLNEWRLSPQGSVGFFRFKLVEQCSLTLKVPTSTLNTLQDYRFSEASWALFKGMIN